MEGADVSESDRKEARRQKKSEMAAKLVKSRREECLVNMSDKKIRIRDHLRSLARVVDSYPLLTEMARDLGLCDPIDTSAELLHDVHVYKYFIQLKQAWGKPSRNLTMDKYRRFVYMKAVLSQMRDDVAAYSDARRRMPAPKIGPKLFMPRAIDCVEVSDAEYEAGIKRCGDYDGVVEPKPGVDLICW